MASDLFPDAAHAPPQDGPAGLIVRRGRLSENQQGSLVAAVRAAAEGGSPFYRPAMPRTGAPLSVRMTNFGPLGWVTDREGGYRYEPRHPVTGEAWPPMPPLLTELWDELGDWPDPPQACLVNYYDADARMGLHVDSDEEATSAPVVSVSLGDDALFRIARAPGRTGPTVSFCLRSGDVVALTGPARACRHGVDRIYPGTSGLLPKGGRLNLTMRRVTAA